MKLSKYVSLSRACGAIILATCLPSPAAAITCEDVQTAPVGTHPVAVISSDTMDFLELTEQSDIAELAVLLPNGKCRYFAPLGSPTSITGSKISTRVTVGSFPLDIQAGASFVIRDAAAGTQKGIPAGYSSRVPNGKQHLLLSVPWKSHGRFDYFGLAAEGPDQVLITKGENTDVVISLHAGWSAVILVTGTGHPTYADMTLDGVPYGQQLYKETLTLMPPAGDFLVSNPRDADRPEIEIISLTTPEEMGAELGVDIYDIFDSGDIKEAHRNWRNSSSGDPFDEPRTYRFGVGFRF